MEDNSRVYKEAYRTCKREYDSLIRKHESVKRRMGWKAALVRLLPVLIAAELIIAVLYFLMPAHRDVLGFLLPVCGIGPALGLIAYIAALLTGSAAEKDAQRLKRLRSIIDELDEAWVEHDENEAALRSLNAERELRKTQSYSVSGIRERVMNGARTPDEGGDVV